MTLSKTELTELRIKRIQAKSHSLTEMLVKQKQLVDEGIDALTREFASAPAGPDAKGPLALTDKDAKKLDVLSTALAKLVTAEIQWKKQLKADGEAMTPEEEDEAVVAYIKALPPDRREKVQAKDGRREHELGRTLSRPSDSR